MITAEQFQKELFVLSNWGRSVETGSSESQTYIRALCERYGVKIVPMPAQVWRFQATRDGFGFVSPTLTSITKKDDLDVFLQWIHYELPVQLRDTKDAVQREQESAKFTLEAAFKRAWQGKPQDTPEPPKKVEEPLPERAFNFD